MKATHHNNRPTLEARLNSFFAPFHDSAVFAQDLATACSRGEELLTVVCCRLDTLANLTFPNQPKAEAFTRLVRTHGGGLLPSTRVSTPDLYFALAIGAEMAAGYVPVPGRLHNFGHPDDLWVLHLIDSSGLPLTERDMRAFLLRMASVLRERYGVVPRQRRTKAKLEDLGQLVALLAEVAHRRGAWKDDPGSTVLARLLERFTLPQLLYREVRCSIVHRFPVEIDEGRFFREREVYWVPVSGPLLAPDRMFRSEFPALLLCGLYQRCLEGVEKALRARRKLPVDIWNCVCDLIDEVGYLDQSTLAEGKNLRVNLR